MRLMDLDLNTGDVATEAALSDRELVLQFESIGDNCELGLLQRQAGAEPLGLLRFSGTPLRNLLRGLRARFEGITDPRSIRIHEENGEYMVKLTMYDFYYHAHVKTGDMTPVQIHQQQCRTIGFLVKKLIDDLENPSKILVFRQNEPLLAADLVDLRVALANYGPNILLWVQEARPGHAPGSVDVVDDGLMVGYVRRLAARDAVPDLDLDSWLVVLRKAYELSLMGSDERAEAAHAAERLWRTDLVFGSDGNARQYCGYGWSGPEAGYQWAVGERSLLTIDSPGDANQYWLEMDVTPFIKLPLVPKQRLDVFVGGTFVHSFDPVPRGEIGCMILGSLISGQDQVEIVLGHPYAASPMLAANEGDDRRLAVSFNRLSLVSAPTD